MEKYAPPRVYVLKSNVPTSRIGHLLSCSNAHVIGPEMDSEAACTDLALMWTYIPLVTKAATERFCDSRLWSLDDGRCFQCFTRPRYPEITFILGNWTGLWPPLHLSPASCVGAFPRFITFVFGPATFWHQMFLFAACCLPQGP